MRESKFIFLKILFNGSKGQNSSPTLVTITKQGQLMFNTRSVETFRLENRIVDFVYDPQKRTLGMRLITDKFPEGNWTKSMRQIKKQGTTYTVSIGRIFTAIGYDIKRTGSSIKGLELKKYKDLLTGEVLYVKLPKLKEVNSS
mgnify:CR=1 FL=1